MMTSWMVKKNVGSDFLTAAESTGACDIIANVSVLRIVYMYMLNKTWIHARNNTAFYYPGKKYLQIQ
mgnify:CR=1 FL=1